MKNDWADLDTVWMGCKILVFSLGFFYGESCIPAKGVARAKTNSFLTNSCLCPGGPWVPLTAAHTGEQLSCCCRLDEELLRFPIGKMRKSSVCQQQLFPKCAAQLPASWDPWISPASCWSWTIAPLVFYEWISSHFESLPPHPTMFQKCSGKTPKKGLLYIYSDYLTTSLHAPQFSQVQFFHMIDDFVCFCQIQFDGLFSLSWRISSVSFWGWSAFLLIPVGTAAPTSAAVSPLVHMIEADATEPELKPCSESMTDIVEMGKYFHLLCFQFCRQ